MENNSKSFGPRDKILIEILANTQMAKAQNETLLQNQIILNFKLMAIVEHLGIELDPNWPIEDSETLKESREIIASNYQQYLDDSLLSMGVDADSLKKP